MSEDSEFLYHEPCPGCGSSDALARYDDGHAYCFSCEHFEPSGSEGKSVHAPSQSTHADKGLLPAGEVRELRKRRLSADTCRKFGYTLGEFKGRPVQIAPYYNLETGQLCGQKVRFPDKEFVVKGTQKGAGLFGHQLWTSGGRMVVVTEGEIDCLSVSQLQGNKWPVVSLPNGAPSAKKALAANLDWLLQYETVILLFDNDEVGHKANEECAPLFPPGRCKIAQLPLKDANEMLVAGRGDEVMRAIWNAKPYRPSGIVTLGDILDDALKPVEEGLPWPWPSLTKATHGRRRGEIYTLGAGTGVGKTDVWTQTAAYTVRELDLPVGMFYLEQPPAETANRMAGKAAGRPFHIPGGLWTEEERVETLRSLDETGKVYLYSHFGGADWCDIKQRIRWLVVSEGVQDIFLDHLTALATGADKSEKEELEAIMSEIGSMTQELGFTLYLISHLATPEGKPHEEGGRVMIRHFKGSRAIGFWSYFMFGLERDQQEKDPERRHISTFRILKDRLTGQATGTVFYLRFDADTGLLHECAPPAPKETKGAKEYGLAEDDDEEF